MAGEQKKVEATTMKLPADAMRTLRTVKADLKYAGIYATHELIVAWLISTLRGRRLGALRASLRDVKPPLRGRHKKKRLR
jgi:hypothetical protein